MAYGLPAFIGFVTTLVVTPLVGRWAISRQWTDNPDGDRKLHARPTPSVGGIALIIGAAVGMSSIWVLTGAGPDGELITLIVGAGCIAGIGFWDDVRGLDFRWRLIGETIVAAVVVLAGFRFDLFSSSGALVGATEYIISVVWIVSVVNAVNVIDGVDGLASGVVGIALGALAIVAVLAGATTGLAVVVVLIGTVLAFLVHNFRPATVFMGDTGSLYLGYVVATYSIYVSSLGSSGFGLVSAVLVIGYPTLDIALSVVRRSVGKKSIYTADRDHIHHRLVSRMPVGKAVGVIYAVSALFGLLAVVASRSSLTGGSAMVGSALTVGIVVLVRLGYVRMPYSPPRLEAFSSRQEPLRGEKKTVAADDTPLMPSPPQEIA